MVSRRNAVVRGILSPALSSSAGEGAAGVRFPSARLEERGEEALAFFPGRFHGERGFAYLFQRQELDSRRRHLKPAGADGTAITLFVIDDQDGSVL